MQRRGLPIQRLERRPVDRQHGGDRLRFSADNSPDATAAINAPVAAVRSAGVLTGGRSSGVGRPLSAATRGSRSTQRLARHPRSPWRPWLRGWRWTCPRPARRAPAPPSGALRARTRRVALTPGGNACRGPSLLTCQRTGSGCGAHATRSAGVAPPLRVAEAVREVEPIPANAVLAELAGASPTAEAGAGGNLAPFVDQLEQVRAGHDLRRCSSRGRGRRLMLRPRRFRHRRLLRRITATRSRPARTSRATSAARLPAGADHGGANQFHVGATGDTGIGGVTTFNTTGPPPASLRSRPRASRTTAPRPPRRCPRATQARLLDRRRVHVFVNGKTASGLTYGAVVEIQFDTNEAPTAPPAGPTLPDVADIDEPYPSSRRPPRPDALRR
jgi:hypothetical protein